MKVRFRLLKYQIVLFWGKSMSTRKGAGIICLRSTAADLRIDATGPSNRLQIEPLPLSTNEVVSTSAKSIAAAAA
jgi:hypothetical protein